MPTFEEFYQNATGLAGAAGGLAGRVAENEFIAKPAAAKRVKEQQLQQAIFTNNFPLASKLAQELGLVGSDWDYQEENIPNAVLTPTSGKASTLPNAVNFNSPVPPSPTAPAPLSEGFYASAMHGQNLSNPMGLSGTFQNVMSQSLIPGKTADVELAYRDATKGMPWLNSGASGPRTDMPIPFTRLPARDVQIDPQTWRLGAPKEIDMENSKVSYRDQQQAPLTWAEIQQGSTKAGQMAAAMPDKLMDFTPLAETRKTDKLADTESNKARLMAMYTGKMPGPEYTKDYNDAILEITPGVGFNPTKVKTVAKGGLSEKDKAVIEGREDVAKIRGEDAWKRALLSAGTAKRGQDLRFQAAGMRLAAANSSDSGMSIKEISALSGIHRSVDAVRRSYVNQMIEANKANLNLIKNPGIVDEINRQADELASAEFQRRVMETGNQRLIAGAGVYMSGDQGGLAVPPAAAPLVPPAPPAPPARPQVPAAPRATAVPPVTPPAATPVPVRPAPQATPAPTQRPVAQPRPQATQAPAAARPTVRPPQKPQGGKGSKQKAAKKASDNLDAIL